MNDIEMAFDNLGTLFQGIDLSKNNIQRIIKVKEVVYNYRIDLLEGRFKVPYKLFDFETLKWPMANTFLLQIWREFSDNEEDAVKEITFTSLQIPFVELYLSKLKDAEITIEEIGDKKRLNIKI